MGLMRMAHEQPGKKAKADSLGNERKGGRDKRLGGYDGRQRRKHDERHEQRLRREIIEQLPTRDRTAAKQIRSLTKIVEEQRGKNNREPTDADRERAEVTKVSVHRLAAGHDQHHRTQDQQR